MVASRNFLVKGALSMDYPFEPQPQRLLPVEAQVHEREKLQCVQWNSAKRNRLGKKHHGGQR